MRGRAFNILKYLLGWPFALVAFFFILRLIIPQIPTIIPNLHGLNYALLLCGIFSFLLFYFVRSYIWHRLLKAYSQGIPYRKSSYLWAISEVKRYIPGSIFAFLGRTILFADLGISKKEVGKLLITEAAIFVVGASIISLLSLPFLTMYFLPQFNHYIYSGAVVLILSSVLIYVFNRRIFKFLPEYKSTENLFLLFLSSIALMFFGLANYFAITSFINLPLNLIFQLSGFFVLSILMGYLSLLTPAGFGVREGIIIAGLSKLINLANSAFAALFSRIVLILSELLFIGITYLWYRTKNRRVRLVEKWVARNKHESTLVFIALIYLMYFTIVSFLRFEHFYTGTFDLGNMAQTVWNTTQGRIFQFTNPHGTDMISRLAFHADFLLILIAPIYAIVPSPKTLLFIQTLVVTFGSFFVYKIAKNKLNDKNLALALSFSYLISPAVQRANLYDFHSVTLATTFLLGMYYYYSEKRYALFLVFTFLAGISKEQIWLIVALFGFLILIKQKKKLLGSILFMGSISVFYYLVAIAIPRTLGSSHFALSYYSEFGDGPASIIKAMVLSPQKIVGSILEKDKINYLVQIFSHVGYLPAVFPSFLILAGPDLLINLLSSNAQLHQIYYHYTAAITPFIYLSSIFGIYYIQKIVNKKYYVILTIYILGAAIYSAYKYGPLPGSLDPNLDMFIKPVNSREFINHQLSLIPDNLSVAASNNVGSHLTNRQRVYTLPLGIEKADVVIFLLNNSEQPHSTKIQRSQLLNLRIDPNYEIAAEKDSFVIFKKKRL